jgi:hypothetical protein
VGLRKHAYTDHLSFVVRLEGLAILRYLFGFPAMESSGQSLNEITLFMKTFEKVCQDVDDLVTSVGVSLSHQVYTYHFLLDFATVLFLILILFHRYRVQSHSYAQFLRIPRYPQI